MVDTETLANNLEALLFTEGGTLPRSKLHKMLFCSAEELEKARELLSARLTHGIALVATETDLALVVAPQSAPVVDVVFAPENNEIGDAGLEILAILLYKGASTRATIDYIRGVNSSFSIRSLLTRGLVERTHNPDDSREYLYRPTVELLAHLGIRSSQELPEYATILAELTAFQENNAFSREHTTDA